MGSTAALTLSSTFEMSGSAEDVPNVDALGVGGSISKVDTFGVEGSAEMRPLYNRDRQHKNPQRVLFDRLTDDNLLTFLPYSSNDLARLLNSPSRISVRRPVPNSQHPFRPEHRLRWIELNLSTDVLSARTGTSDQ